MDPNSRSDRQTAIDDGEAAGPAPSAVRHCRNPRYCADPLGMSPQDVEAARAIRAAVRSDRDYAPTPLRPRPRTAAALGLGALAIKDEGARLASEGLACFKALGVMSAIADLLRGSAEPVRRLVCASDGNYGRAVAWGARRAGLKATVFMPETVSRGRVAAIRALGAEVRRLAGGYDRAIAAAWAESRADGVVELSDTGHDGAEAIPLAIQRAYGVLAEECLDEVEVLGGPPTHLFVPVGVGGLAAGLVETFDCRLGRAAPRTTTVEPLVAASLLESLSAGRIVSVPEIGGSGSHPPTVMLGLACETPSTTAWPILRRRVADALAVPDAQAVAAMRELSGGPDTPDITAGESGAAGYAGLLAASADPQLRRALRLGVGSRALVVMTEGATDPAVYEELVGKGHPRR